MKLKLITLLILLTSLTFGQSELLALFDDEPLNVPTEIKLFGAFDYIQIAANVTWTIDENGDTLIDENGDYLYTINDLNYADSLRILRDTATVAIPTTWIASMDYYGVYTDSIVGVWNYRFVTKKGNLFSDTSAVFSSTATTYNLYETFADGDYTSGNVWTVGSGTFSISASANGGYDGASKYLTNTGTSVISIPCTQAYGTWEFDFYKINQIDIKFVGSNTAIYSGDTDNYMSQLTGSGRAALFKGVTATTLFYSAASYIANSVWYRVKITRSAANVFTYYIKGGAYGTDYVLVSATGGAGTNPVTDATYTTSAYIVIKMFVSGESITNLKFY